MYRLRYDNGDWTDLDCDDIATAYTTAFGLAEEVMLDHGYTVYRCELYQDDDHVAYIDVCGGV